MKRHIPLLPLWSGKLIFLVLRTIGFRASAFPGAVANRLDKDFLRKVSEGVDVYLITGTNGKTTTTGYIYGADKLGKDRIICNQNRSNMKNGMTTAFVTAAKWSGRMDKKIAVLECDELSLPVVAPSLDLKGILINNIHIDQTDRIGGCEKLMKILHDAIATCPGATLYLNADDNRVVALADDLPNNKVWYGSEIKLSEAKEFDGNTCPKCGKELEYSLHTLGHLGHYKCPGCGFERPEPDVAITSFKAGKPMICILKELWRNMEFPLEDVRPERLYNLAAAYTLWEGTGGSWEDIARGVLGYGRKLEKITVTRYKDCNVTVEMVKNPIGANMVVGKFLESDRKDLVLFLGLNNSELDSVDTSWINYVDFESLAAGIDRILRIYIAGDAVEDLKKRLLRAGIPKEKLITVDNKKWDTVFEEKEVLAFMSGTASSKLKKILNKASKHEKNKNN